jgi:hypothetical protein
VLRPTPGELLAGVRRELMEQVLPAVPAGAPARQLKAALHVLAQLERTWDLQPAYLAADNADLRATLAELTARTGIRPAPHPDRGEPVPGVQDTALAEAIRENEQLQADLDEVQQAWRAGGRGDPAVDQLLFDLHVRMAERALVAAGLSS